MPDNIPTNEDMTPDQAPDALRPDSPDSRDSAKPAGFASGNRHINDRGIELVKHFEAFYPKAYQDEVGIWTIGWGHTGLKHNDGTVYRGRTITEEQGEALLKYDMNVFERRVDRLVSVPLTDDQYSALVSFDFNTGGLEGSTLRKLLNQGDYDSVPSQLLRWDKAGGKRLKGLTRRRISEGRLFQGEANFICQLDDPELRAIYA